MPEDATPPTVDAIEIRIKDVVHVLDIAGITPAQAGALRQQSHGDWRVPTLMAAVAEGVGPEEIQGLLFLAKRQAGDPTSYDDLGRTMPSAGEIVINFTTLALLDATDPDADPNG